MDEAINELRNAVHQALSLDPNDRSDELINSDVQVESSESTYISSLSGSLPSERSTAASSRRKLFYDSNGDVIVEGDTDGRDADVSPTAWKMPSPAMNWQDLISKANPYHRGSMSRSNFQI